MFNSYEMELYSAHPSHLSTWPSYLAVQPSYLAARLFNQPSIPLSLATHPSYTLPPNIFAFTYQPYLSILLFCRTVFLLSHPSLLTIVTLPSYLCVHPSYCAQPSIPPTVLIHLTLPSIPRSNSFLIFSHLCILLNTVAKPSVYFIAEPQQKLFSFLFFDGLDVNLR